MDHSSGLVFRRPQATLTADLWSIFAPPFSPIRGRRGAGSDANLTCLDYLRTDLLIPQRLNRVCAADVSSGTKQAVETRQCSCATDDCHQHQRIVP